MRRLPLAAPVTLIEYRRNSMYYKKGAIDVVFLNE